MMLDLAIGRDATIMFESMHNSPAAKAALCKLPVVTDPAFVCERVTGVGMPQDSKLYRELKDLVFSTKRDRAVPAFHVTAVLIAFLLSACWFVAWPTVCTGMLLGLTMTWVGTGVQHTANHGGLCRRPALNWLFGLTSDVVPGGSSLVWRYHHQVSHHQFCNDPTHDQDVHSSFPLVRLDETQPRFWYHRFQAYYAPVMFYALYFSIQAANVQQLIAMRCFQTDFRGSSKAEVCLAFVLKLVHVGWLWILPASLHGWRAMIVPWLACTATGGFVLATLFVVSHNLTATKNKPSTSDDWAKMQIETSASWGGHVASFFMGGLNLQIEHHLFPSLAHHHYAAIQPIVERTCAKHGVRYAKYANLLHIYVDFVRYLRVMGEDTKLRGD